MKETLRLNFGQKLKKLRQQQKLTQEELADLAKIDYKYLQKIEGKNPPNVSLKVIEKLSDAMKIPAEKFFKF